MPVETYLAANPGQTADRYQLTVIQEGDHWTSTLARVDDAGVASSAKVAPRFYGLTEEQARRKMLTTLENQYEDVRLIRES
ncbi:MAG: hypothetical protein JNG88_15145 [Phycisphaerales bacterium]|nr:hypothetical protein [Phycisphaerales bacterium]